MHMNLAVFDNSLEKTNRWLKELETELGCSRHTAYSVLRAVLHALRDRITVAEAVHFSSQMPMLVRGLFFEGWKPSTTPQRFLTQDEFISYTRDMCGQVTEVPLDQAVRAVLASINRHVTEGQAEQVRHMLPDDIKQLWPEPAQKAA